DALRLALEKGASSESATAWLNYQYEQKRWIEILDALEAIQERYPGEASKWNGYKVLFQIQMGEFEKAWDDSRDISFNFISHAAALSEEKKNWEWAFRWHERAAEIAPPIYKLSVLSHAYDALRKINIASAQLFLERFPEVHIELAEREYLAGNQDIAASMIEEILPEHDFGIIELNVIIQQLIALNEWEIIKKNQLFEEIKLKFVKQDYLNESEKIYLSISINLMNGKINEAYSEIEQATKNQIVFSNIILINKITLICAALLDEEIVFNRTLDKYKNQIKKLDQIKILVSIMRNLASKYNKKIEDKYIQRLLDLS
ncbi:hypothetical protein, partial [Rhodohalobacter sulfatireducens]